MILIYKQTGFPAATDLIPEQCGTNALLPDEEYTENTSKLNYDGSYAMTDQTLPTDLRELRFFNQMKRQQPLVEVLEKYGFAAPKPYERVVNRRERLKFEKVDWILPRLEHQIDGVCLYFASNRRGDFRLCVDLDPHRLQTWNEEDTERKAQRDAANAQKAALLKTIRDRLLKDEALRHHVDISAKSLRNASKPYTMTAVKFDLHLAPDSTPEEFAKAFSAVIDAVTPVVNTIIAEQLKKKGRRTRNT